MERRDFIQKSMLTTAAVGVAGLGSVQAQTEAGQKEVYELRVYHTRRSYSAIETYFEKVLIPALNRLGVKHVGVYKETSLSEPTRIYMLIPYASFEEFGRITLTQKTDKQLLAASADYARIKPENAVFDRYDSSLLLAFDGHPKLEVPSKKHKLRELRTYEGYNEDAVRRKVKMFNEGEMAIFKDVKLPAVFYSENITGKDLPCLTYMAAYEDMAERDRIWDAFRVHPEWVKMSALPEYANSVSRIHRVFLEPVSYSQL